MTICGKSWEDYAHKELLIYIQYYVGDNKSNVLRQRGNTLSIGNVYIRQHLRD